MRRAAVFSLRCAALVALACAFSLIIAWIAALPTFTPPATPPMPNWVDVDTSMCWAIGQRTARIGRTDWSIARVGPVTPFQLTSWKDVPVPERAPTSSIRSIDGPGGFSGHIRTSGWPRPCLWGAVFHRAGFGPKAIAPVRETHQLVTPRLLAPHLKSCGIDGGLPTGVLWSGLALNTLIFSALFVLARKLPRAARRFVRERRGRCAACGYDLHATPDNAPCPECGAVTATTVQA